MTKEFDADIHREETTNVAIYKAFQVIGEQIETIPFGKDVEASAINAAITEVSMKVLEVLVEAKVPMSDMQYFGQAVQTIVGNIIKNIEGHQLDTQEELMARTLGVRNPGLQDRYDAGFATTGDLFETLKKVRAEQGDKVEDYFFVEKKEAEEEK